MKVAVIMSTYNGQKYIREQINSILSQTDVEVELFIRDDGSSDETVNIIREYESYYSNVHIDVGRNIGFRQSFMMELKKASGFEYYAFSDQDDMWEKEKLHAACILLKSITKKENKPTVYYSNLNVTDEKLNIYRKTKLEKRKHSMESLVMRRSIAGCTMMFNASMWKCINSVRLTDDMLKRGHDSFILSLCYAVGGKVICDPNAYIQYRQHTNNASGGSHGLFQRIKKEWNMLINKKGTEPAIARSILDNWSELIDEKNRQSLQLIAGSEKNIRCRLGILFSPKFTTGDFRLTCMGKIKAIFGLL